MIEAIHKYLSQPQFATMTVGSQTVKPADIVTILQDRIDAGKAALTADAARTAAVKADRDKRAQSAALLSSFRRMIQGMYTQSPDTLAAFGLKAPRAGKKTVETKATALVKGKATRALRHTLGAKQKKAIKGTAPTATSGPAPVPATPPKPST
jgi:hypothetical protein